MKTRFASFLLLPCALFADCLKFPANLVPLSSVSYVTAANSAGDHLVVGALAGGASALNALAAQIPVPTSTNQVFCDPQVQLAPQQFYSNVYVPTPAELSGNFSAFANLLVNPANNQPYPGGIIPAAQLGQVFAFRIGAAQATQTARGWNPTGTAPFQIGNSPAIVLPSGKVFIPTSPSLFYDPLTGTFTSGPVPLFNQASWGQAVLLDNGLVFIPCGQGAPSSAQLYDPVSAKFTALPSTLQGHAYGYTATKLNDGRVLIVGGAVDNSGVESGITVNAGAELFDPKTKTFSSAVPMIVKRRRHMATVLADGTVLVAGGSAGPSTLDSAEIYDPVKNTFTLARGFLSVPRTSPTAVLLPNGKVLIAGGFGVAGTADLFDPSLGTFSATGSMAADHGNGRAALLPSGQVLIFGGRDFTHDPQGPVTNSTEIYNPASGTFSPGGALARPRLAPVTTLLLDGRVLVVGGQPTVGLSNFASAEIYTPLAQGLVTSQTGLTFRAAQASTSASTQTVAVLSPSDTIPWITSVKTYSGGNWLKVVPSNATSIPGAQVPLNITVDPTGLAAQDYYGAVTLTPTDQKHPPISIAVVFSVVPAGAAAPLSVSPNGEVFTSVFGSSAQPQSFKISSVSSAAIGFTAAASANPWFDFAPKGGTITTRHAPGLT